MRHECLVVAAGLMLAPLTVGQAAAADCVVADPTGTPLNVRIEPNGQILSRLDNGRAVVVLAEKRVGGKGWAQVASEGDVLGWVFAAFLDCRTGASNLKSAPMKPRLAP
ncbi:SH3 domain-containing protein [Pararhizobium gei]|uniref:SH3 domain-containing protein n=1 Tax=Pararhizobium gei TaxID=1395951 RepID=UPI0023D9AB1D|nr:SH3 domain-containing protein [Rhizobium gei]